MSTLPIALPRLFTVMFQAALAVVFTLGVFTSTSAAQEYKRMPWHLIDLYWDLGKDTPFESYSLDVTISEDVPSSKSLYIAPMGLGFLDKTQFYGGIQTNADGHTKTDTKVRKLGHGLLMSMWGERSLDAIRPSDGGFCQSAGHEGDFVSIRRPYEWTKGTYTYRIAKMDKETVDDKPTTWVGAFLYAHDKDENIFIGALRFPGENLTLRRSTASFVEIYGHAVPVEEIPKLSVTFGNWKVNGKAIDVTSAKALYPEGTPDYAEASEKDKSIVVEVGTKVEERKQRRQTLIPKP